MLGGSSLVGELLSKVVMGCAFEGLQDTLPLKHGNGPGERNLQWEPRFKVNLVGWYGGGAVGDSPV